MAPDHPLDENLKSHKIRKKTFPELLEHVRLWRRIMGKKSAQMSYSNFNFKVQPIKSAEGCDTSGYRLYALGRAGESSEHTLLYVDMQNNESRDGNKECKTLVWKPLQESTDVPLLFRGTITKEEEILRERMRCLISGIISYDFHPESCSFLFSASARLYRCDNFDEAESVGVEPIDHSSIRSPMDAKMCPTNANLISYVSSNDLYLQLGSSGYRATYTQDNRDRHLTAGVASFVIQEEFDRYTGYWWCPVKNDDGKFYILYEENDETSVTQLSINVPAARSENVELMRYPRAGGSNARWTLKMLQITVREGMETGDQNRQDVTVKELMCSENFRELFPWAEYLVRAGWMPDGKGVWIEIMSRIQNRFALVFIPVSCFVEVLCHGRGTNSMEDLSTTEQGCDSQAVVLYEECSDCWINLHDCIQFLDFGRQENCAQFIWCHSKTGYSHLYLIQSMITSGDDCNRPVALSETLDFDKSIDVNLGVPLAKPPQIHSEFPLTSGDWEVCKKAEPFVDKRRKLIYFLGLKDSPLETHIYCVNLDHLGGIFRVTELGYSHCSPRESHPYQFSNDGQLMVTIRSSLTEIGKCIVYALDHGSDSLFPNPTLVYVLSKQDLLAPEMHLNRIPNPNDIIFPSGWDTPELFSYDSQRTGFTHYAYLFKPAGYQPDVRYPTVLYIYAGPEIQLVRNTWIGHMCNQKYTTLGYVVVMIDGRGSSNRGVHFERPLAANLGIFEIQDQVEILMYVNEMSQCIDTSRVAIIGWSYGGYMALMGLAQKPDFFKVAVSGAPVTHWQLYDTAYTERYMGLPQSTGDAYVRSSVLTYVHSFPEEPGRLLILHGLIDENVHFQHTAIFINALIKAGKPYQLQMYPNDRHAVRNSEASEHMDATILDFLQRNL